MTTGDVITLLERNQAEAFTAPMTNKLVAMTASREINSYGSIVIVLQGNTGAGFVPLRRIPIRDDWEKIK